MVRRKEQLLPLRQRRGRASQSHQRNSQRRNRSLTLERAGSIEKRTHRNSRGIIRRQESPLSRRGQVPQPHWEASKRSNSSSRKKKEQRRRFVWRMGRQTRRRPPHRRRCLPRLPRRYRCLGAVVAPQCVRYWEWKMRLVSSSPSILSNQRLTANNSDRADYLRSQKHHHKNSIIHTETPQRRRLGLPQRVPRPRRPGRTHILIVSIVIVSIVIVIDDRTKQRRASRRVPVKAKARVRRKPLRHHYQQQCKSKSTSTHA